MGKAKKRDYVFLTKWEGQELKCACLFHNPMCSSKVCEEIELSLLPYQDLEECMKEQRMYKRGKGGSIKQIN